MVVIGGRPILWHIMKTYSIHGIEIVSEWDDRAARITEMGITGLCA
jgi:hypothetical protein